MTPDAESLQPSENTEPPFHLTDEQREVFLTSFAADNFKIEVPQTETPYLVVDLPEKVQPLLDAIDAGSRRHALTVMRVVGLGVEDLDEKEQRKAREKLSQNYEEWIEQYRKSEFDVTLRVLVATALQNVKIDELEKIVNSETDQAKVAIAVDDLDNRINPMHKLLIPEDRCIIYSKGKAVVKHPASLIGPV